MSPNRPHRKEDKFIEEMIEEKSKACESKINQLVNELENIKATLVTILSMLENNKINHK